MSESEDVRSLYDIAALNFEAALHIYRIKDSDPAFLNIVGYHLQQSIEIALKHLLEVNGREIFRTHDIDDLLVRTRDLFEDDDIELLEFLAPKITQFATSSKYDKNFLADIKLINKIIDVADGLLKLIKSKDKINEQIAENEILMEQKMKYVNKNKGFSR